MELNNQNLYKAAHANSEEFVKIGICIADKILADMFLKNSAGRIGVYIVDADVDALEAMSRIPRDLSYFVSSSESGSSYLKKLITQWTSYFNTPSPELIVQTSLEEIDVLRLMSHLYHLQHKKALQRAVSLQRSTAMIRVEYENLMASFSAVERRLNTVNLLTREPDLILGPSSYHHPAQNEGMSTAEQTLPCEASGVSDIAIYIQSIPSDGDGQLVIELQAVEDQATLGRWSIKRSNLKLGWLRMGLDRCLPHRNLSLKLAIAWDGEQGLRLGMGVPHPSERWQGSINGQKLGRTIAVKTWVGLANIQMTLDSSAIRQNWSTNRYSSLRLDENVQVDSSTTTPNFVFYNRDLGSIQVHPEGYKPVRARLPRVCPPGTVRITATVETLHSDADLIEYALGVGTDNDAGDFTSETFSPHEQSDWLRLGPRVRSKLSLFLREPAKNDVDLYLLTRTLPGRPTAYSWANFMDIEFEYLSAESEAR